MLRFVARFLAVVLLLLVVLMSSGCMSKYEYYGTLLDPPLSVPNFELKDTSRQPFHLSDIKGDIALVYFGYTFCPDACPLTLGDVKTALTDLKGRDRVKVIFISVDPQRDTPETLRNYLNHFDPDFIGLTDDYAKIQEVMKPFGAFAEKQEAEDSAAGYLVNHTARLYLLSPQQELLLTYSFGFEPDRLREDLVHLLAQMDSGQT